MVIKLAADMLSITEPSPNLSLSFSYTRNSTATTTPRVSSIFTAGVRGNGFLGVPGIKFAVKMFPNVA